MRIYEAIARMTHRDEGAVATEYALLAVLVAVFMVTVLLLVRNQTATLYQLPPLL